MFAGKFFSKGVAEGSQTNEKKQDDKNVVRTEEQQQVIKKKSVVAVVPIEGREDGGGEMNENPTIAEKVKRNHRKKKNREKKLHEKQRALHDVTIFGDSEYIRTLKYIEEIVPLTTLMPEEKDQDVDDDYSDEIFEREARFNAAKAILLLQKGIEDERPENQENELEDQETNIPDPDFVLNKRDNKIKWDDDISSETKLDDIQDRPES